MHLSDAQRLLLQKYWAKTVPTWKTITRNFCSRTLSLHTITITIGHDMDYTLVHYNAKVKTTPLSLAHVIFEQACQSLSQYGSCMAMMKISSLNVCYMTFVSRRNTGSVRFGAQIMYNYLHGHFLCQRLKENQDRWHEFLF